MSVTSLTRVCRKELFEIPDGMIYLDGNSLGPLAKTVAARTTRMIENEWGNSLIKGWNEHKWMEQPARVGNQIARLIGAPSDSIVMGDTLSIKVYQALAAALHMRPQRRVILSDNGNFPTDLYMAQGLIKSLDRDYELRIVDPDEVTTSVDENVAAVLLTHVDYRTGRVHDMDAVTEAAHRNGAVMIWDLAHSAGALPVNLEQSNCEFAVGCTYKYLNGGPGAPAFIYVLNDLINSAEPALAGWHGHDAPFAFDLDYRPTDSIERMRVGTPSVIQLTCLEEALKVWDGISMTDVRAASIQLSEHFIELVEQSCPQLTLFSPRNPAARGSQVSFAFENGYPAMQALIARGVVGDFRAPNVMRFGFTPLFIDLEDVERAAEILQDIMDNQLWDDPKYKRTNLVT